MNNNEIQKLIDNDSDLKELLAAHLGKPEKVELFYNIIKTKMVEGKMKKSSFSWWGFFGGIFYFLYRKMYLYALIIFGVMFIPDILNINSSAMSGAIGVACGFVAIPSYVDKFFKDAAKAGYGNKNIEEVKKEMASLGGYNNWAVVLAIVLTILLVLLMIYDVKMN